MITVDIDNYAKELADLGIPVKGTRLTELSLLGPEDREKLLGVWPTIDAARRQEIVQQLGELARDDVGLNFDTVFMIGLADPDARVRVEAVRGLWEYEGSDLIPLLLRLLAKDKNVDVRVESASTLGRYILMSEHGRLHDRHARSIEEGLRITIADSTEDEDVQARALEAIGACSNCTWVQQAIREAYEGYSPSLRIGAIRAMGRSCDSRWLPILLHELRSHDLDACSEAALACGSIGDEQAITQLSTLLQDSNDVVKLSTIRALGEIGGPEARSVILALPGDLSEVLQDAIQDAITEIDFNDNPLNVDQT